MMMNYSMILTNLYRINIAPGGKQLDAGIIMSANAVLLIQWGVKCMHTLSQKCYVVDTIPVSLDEP